MVDYFVESVDSALVDDVAGGIGVCGEDWDGDHDNEDDHDDLFGGGFGQFLSDFGLLVFELLLDVLVFEEFHGADLGGGVSEIRDFKWRRKRMVRFGIIVSLAGVWGLSNCEVYYFVKTDGIL